MRSVFLQRGDPPLLPFCTLIHKKETKKTEKCEKIRLHSLDFLSFL